MTLLTAATLLFMVMDPLGNVPLFLTALRHVAPERRQRVIARELLIALAVMLVFLFVGQSLLSVLHVSPEALTAAGGVILLLIAIRMIFPAPDHSLEEPIIDEPFIVPLAVPYSAGPSLLATEILMMSQEPERWPVWLLAVVLAWLASSVILYFSGYLQRVLGERTLLAVERLMGMILVVVSMQMLLTGIKEFFGW
ncbi:MAG: NAAT family transporter [Micrococcales bacterium]|nr:NAAT family transporter [Micrococcales bacterium]